MTDHKNTERRDPATHKCCHPCCPGYSWKASDRPHPNDTCGANAPGATDPNPNRASEE